MDSRKKLGKQNQKNFKYFADQAHDIQSKYRANFWICHVLCRGNTAKNIGTRQMSLFAECPSWHTAKATAVARPLVIIVTQVG